MLPYLLTDLGADKVFWFQLYDYPAGLRADSSFRYHGLIDNQGNPKPSYFAYKELITSASPATPPPASATPPAKAIQTLGQAAPVSPIFGVHVVFARNTTPDAAVIRTLGARVTTLWLYPAPGGRFNVHQASQLVNLIKEHKHRQ